jgi:hypothetical protein
MTVNVVVCGAPFSVHDTVMIAVPGRFADPKDNALVVVEPAIPFSTFVFELVTLRMIPPVGALMLKLWSCGPVGVELAVLNTVIVPMFPGARMIPDIPAIGSGTNVSTPPGFAGLLDEAAALFVIA